MPLTHAAFRGVIAICASFYAFAVILSVLHGDYLDAAVMVAVVPVLRFAARTLPSLNARVAAMIFQDAADPIRQEDRFQ